MVVRVLVAGRTAVVGRRLVLQLALAPAEATGVLRFVAQRSAGWNGIRQGGRVGTEEDRLDPGQREPGRQLRHPSWRQGFAEGLA
jgi:hypothetical protein